jgi:hypothetical protein
VFSSCAWAPHAPVEFIALTSSSAQPNPSESVLELAFTSAERSLGIPRLLDASDFAPAALPDEPAMLTYLAYFVNHSSSNFKIVCLSSVARQVFLNDTSSILTPLIRTLAADAASTYPGHRGFQIVRIGHRHRLAHTPSQCPANRSACSSRCLT